jgi:hypothetical protein
MVQFQVSQRLTGIAPMRAHGFLQTCPSILIGCNREKWLALKNALRALVSYSSSAGMGP